MSSMMSDVETCVTRERSRARTGGLRFGAAAFAAVLLTLLPARSAADISQDGFSFSGTVAANALGDSISMTGYSGWPGGMSIGNDHFRGAIFAGGDVWLVPAEADKIVKVATADGSMTAYSLPATGAASGAFVGGVFDGTYIWLIPFNANVLVRVTVADGTMSPYLGSDFPTVLTANTGAFAGGVKVGNKIWLAPFNYDQVVDIDVTDPEAPVITGHLADWPGGFTKGAAAFWGAISDGTDVWLAPYNADRVIKVDGSDGSMTDFSAWPTNFTKASEAFAGGTFDGSFIWLAPYDADRAIKIDITNGTMTGYGTVDDTTLWPAGFATGNSEFAGAVFDGEDIWLVPYHADRLIKIDKNTGDMAGFSNFPSGTFGSTDSKYAGGVFDGNDIWLAPVRANAVARIEAAVGASVQTITRQTPSAAITNDTTVVFRVSFSTSVTGVDTGDFTLTTGASASGTISSVSAASGATIDVTITSVAGDGTLRLDAVGAGIDAGIADFSGGEIYTIDNTNPATPAVTAITTDTGASGTDGITSDQTLVISGTSDPSMSIEVFVDAGSIGTTTANGGGAWSFSYVGTTLAEDSYDITAVATDAAGNSSATSSAFTVVVDKTAPAAPAVTGVTNDTGSSGADGITSDQTVIISGTSEASAAVEVFVDAVSVGTTAANGSGNWSFNYTGTTLAAASYSITAAATDAAGNASGASAPFTLVVDITAPAVPAVTGISNDTGASSTDGITSDQTLVIEGTAVVGASVEVFVDASSVGTVVADGSGDWLFDYTGTTLAAGNYTITATAADTAGNTSAPSAGFSVTIDTTAPVITSGATGSATYGVAGTAYTIIASGSPTSYGATGLPSGLSVNASSGVISGTPTQVASPGVTVSATDDAGNSGSTVITLTVSEKHLTVSGLSATSREYDGTDVAAITGTATLNGVVAGDIGNVSLTGTPTGEFADAAIGDDKAVTISGLSLSGSAAGNYLLDAPTATADITTRTLTVTGVTAQDKEYDGDATATLVFTSPAFPELVTGEDVSLDTSGASGEFADEDVGTAKTVTITGLTLDGADAGNYTLTQPTTTADITAKTLTVTGVTADDKEYDGTVAATLVITSPAFPELESGDIVTLDSSGATAEFADEDVGTGKTVTIAGLTLDGADAGNYTLTQPTATADITAKTLTVTGVTAEDKEYDGTVAATLVITSPAFPELESGDIVTLDDSAATAEFADEDVGTAKTVTIAGLALDGADAGNYTLTQPTATADITAKTLTVTGVTADDKVYDGNADATLVITSPAFPELESGDIVTLDDSAATAEFADEDVGTAKAVTIAGLALDGADAGNYTLTQPTTTADITAKELTVVGITAENKVFDGTTTAVLDTDGAALVGDVSGDDVALDVSAAAGEFDTAVVGTGKTVSISGLSLTGTDAANYTLEQPTATAAITASAAVVVLSDLTQTYDGDPKNVTVATTPSGLVVSLSYEGVPLAFSTTGDLADFASAIDQTIAVNVTGSTAGTVVGTGTYAITSDVAAAAVHAGLLADGETKILEIEIIADTGSYSASTQNGVTSQVGGAAAAAFQFIGEAAGTYLTEGPIDAGSYAVTATVVDPNFSGSDSGVLEIEKATATVTLGDLSQVYDGTARVASATTTPSGLTVDLTYDASATAPTNVGSYAVVGTINDTNYEGSASGTLVVSKATATVTLGSLSQTYNGTARVATATTTPSGLTVNLTYDASATAPTNAGSYAVVGTISDSNYQGSASGTLVVSKATATVTLGSLSQTYNGTARVATATTMPSGLTVNLTYDASATAPTNAGSYAVVGTISDSNYQGSASGTLVVSKAAATVTLGSLSQTYNGTARVATATTTPSGLTVNLTYDASATAPTNAGSYAVVGTISDSNYQGSASGTLVVSKAAATVTLGSLSQTYNGTARVATATTTPSGLTVNLTYDASATAPTNVGSYAVVGTISDTNYTGSATGTLVVSKATATVTISNTTQTYDGSAKAVTVVTSPSGLAVATTYDGSATLPTEIGSYAVVAQVTNPNYLGSANAVLTIDAANFAGEYFGTFADGGDWALFVRPDGTGVFLASISASQSTGAAPGETANAEHPMAAAAGDWVEVATLTISATGGFSVATSDGLGVISGQIVGGTVAGTVTGHGLVFSGTIDSPTGSTASVAGFYDAAIVLSADGEVLVIAGSDGHSFVLIQQNGAAAAAAGALDADGTLQVTLSNGQTVDLALDETTGRLTGSLSDSTQTWTLTGAEENEVISHDLLALSMRAQSLTGDDVMIAGLVISGSGTKHVLIRGIGPGLGTSVSDRMTNPFLRFFRLRSDGSGWDAAGENDNWGNATNAQAIDDAAASIGLGRLTAGSQDAAALLDLSAGVYTAHLIGVGNTTGVALVEVYDADPGSAGSAEFTGISMRGRVGTGNAIMIPGFIITGDTPKRVLVRGIGPDLTGVTGPLADPTLRVFRLENNGSSTQIAFNNDWETGNDRDAVVAATNEVGLGQLSAGSKSAALVIWLEPGVYTAHVAGANSTTGVALVEMYSVP